MERKLRFVLILATLVGIGGNAYAQFTTKGKAVRTTQHCFRVTEDKNSQLGAVWFDEKIDLSTAVDLEFNIFMGDKDQNGADGIGFVMHNDPRGQDAIGDAGGGLGFGAHPSQQGRKITPSVAIEFDTWRNGECKTSPNEDLQEDHTTVVYNGDMCSPLFPPVRLKPSPPFADNNVEDNKCYNYRIRWNPENKTLSLFIENTLVFVHTDDFVDKVFGGQTEVYYGFTGSTGGSKNEQTVCIIGQNTTPVAIDDQATTTEGRAVTVDVLSNDSDADGDPVYVTEISQTPGSGSVRIDDNGQVTYTPNPGFVGQDNFGYQVCDVQPASCYANCDQATVTIQVNREASSCVMVVNAQADPTSCQTASDGRATVTVSGGVGPFTYLWNDESTSEQLSDLAPGTYEVTVTDAVGCQATATATVVASDQPCPRVRRLQLQAQCSDNADELRWLIVNSNATTVEVEYEIETTGQRTALSVPPGGLDLVTSSALGDVVWIYWTNETGEEVNARRKSPKKRCSCAADFSLTATDAACEESTGSIRISELQGSGRYRYLWSNGATSKNLQNVSPGLYSVTVTDRATEEECSITKEVTVGVTSPQIVLTIEQPLSCDDATDGKIRTSVSGGKSPYTFSWEHGVTTRNLNQLAAGEYALTITDANGCQSTERIVLAKPGKACISPLALSSRCSDDEAQLQWQVSNPNEVPVSFRYEIIGDPEQTGTLVVEASTSTQLSTVNNEGAKRLKITWEDEKEIERSATQGASLLRCSCNLAYRLETKAASCEEENGRIKLVITEGSGRYDFLWSTGATTRNVANLSAGTYSVTVTDKGTEEACVLAKEIVVASAAPSVSLSLSGALSCYEAQDAVVSSTVTGGQAPYTYQWNSGQTTSDIDGLSAGSYTLTVTDAKGCEVVQSIEVTAPDVPCRIVSPLNLTSFCDDDLSRRRWRVKNPNDFAVAVTYEVVGAPDQTATVTAEASGDTYFFTQTVNGANTVKIHWEDQDGNSQSKVKAASNQQCNCQLTYELIVKDVACDDPNSGGVQLRIDGGSGNYRYAWNTGATTQNLTNLTAGTYSVTVTDLGTQASCEITKEITVASSKPTIVLSVDSPLSCDGAQDASIRSQVSGGQAPYTYRWSNGGTTANLNDLPSGEYTLSVTDAAGCEVVEQIQIAAPGEPCQLVSPLNLTSFCDDDLSQRRWRIKNPNDFAVEVTYEVVGDASQTALVTAQASGETFFYTQKVAGANTVKIFWNDEAGNRQTKVKAASNQQCTCQLAYELVATNAACDQANSGQVQLQISGGSGNYSYLWSTGATTKDLTGVPAGSYSVTVTDKGTQENCVVTQEIVVRSAAPTVSLAIGNPLSCDDSDDAVISSTVSGGQAPYSYQWSNGQTTAGLDDLSAGTYTLSVTDAGGCEVSQRIEIVAPGQPCQVVDGLNLTSFCDDDLTQRRWRINNPNDFAVAVTYEVVGDASQTGVVDATPGDFYFYTQKVSGPNTVKIYWEDQDGVKRSKVKAASNQQCTCLLSYDLVATSAGCADQNSGSVALRISEGSGNYQYQWSTGATTQNLEGVPAGTYSVTVTDRGTQANCVITQEVTVGSAGPSVALTLTNPLSCAEATDGQVSSTVSGGQAPYSYQWSNGQTTADIGALAAGEYTLTVKDAQGCEATQTIEITAPSEPCQRVAPLTVVSACDDDPTLRQWTITNPNEFPVDVTYLVVGSANEATTTVSAAASASVNTPQTEGASTLSISWLNEEDQVVTAEAESSDLTCSCILAYTLTPGKINCDTDQGTITLTVTGGSGNYGYAWSTGATTRNLTDVPAGTYSVTVTDQGSEASCAVTQEATLAASDLAVVLSVESALSCQEASDGSIRSQVSGGEAPYTYRWNTSGTGSGLDNLSAGTYSLTVTDARGCQAIQEITLTTPDEPCASIIPLVLTSACEDDPGQRRWKINNPNSVSVEVTYELEQDPTQTATLTVGSGDTYFTTTAVTGLNAATIRWLDAAGQTATATATATNERCTCALAYTLVPTDPSCGSSSGSIILNVTQGSGNYRYAWSTGATTQNLTDLSAGTYSVTVTDAGTEADCSVTREVTISEQTPSIVLNVDRNPSCSSAVDGRISSSVSGGQAPYTYTWITGASGSQLNNVGAGTYTLTVTDAGGCRVSESITIATPRQACDDGLILSFRPTDVSCDRDRDGSAVLDIRGGSGSYRYAWSTGATTKNISELVPGTYSVTVTDAANPTVSQSASVTIRQDNTPVVSVQVSNRTLCGGGSVLLTAQGGSGDYRWYPGGQTTASIEVTQPGGYYVTVTNGSCAVTSETVTIDYQPTSVQIVRSRNSLCEGEAVTLTSSVAEGNVWSTGQTSRSITVDAAGTYSLSIATDCGDLEASATIAAKAEEECREVCDPVSFPVLPKDEPCDRFSADLVVANAQRKYEGYLRRKRQEFELGYRAHCLDASENFTMEFEDKEHHRTLYYYDQAGNLVRTVPPEGVKLITDARQLAQVKSDRAGGRKHVFTEHELATTYSYNSLNQLVTQDMPDHAQLELRDTRDLSASIPDGLTIVSTQFSDAQNGYLIASDGDRGYFFTTEDGGQNWSSLSKIGLEDLQAVQLVSPTVAYAVGERGTLLKSTDGGESWVLKPIPTLNTLSHVLFLNETEGWVYEEDGTAWFTSDGIASGVWEREDNLKNVVTGTLTGVDNYDNFLLASSKTDQRGYMYFSDDLGENWRTITGAAPGDLSAVSFVNQNVGFAAGPQGRLLKTTDQALSWQPVNTQETSEFSYVRFFGSTQGYALLSRRLVKTDDGGQSWQQVSETFLGLRVLYMEDRNVGYGSDNRNLWKTTNGGLNWTEIGTGTWSGLIKGVHFQGNNAGHVFLSNGEVYATANGGANWQRISSRQYLQAWSWIADTDVVYGLWDNGGLYKSTDGGANWRRITSRIGLNLTAVDFVNEQEGYAVGDRGSIYQTTNGGFSWLMRNQVQLSPVHDVSIRDYANMYAVGSGGAIYHATSYGGYGWVERQSNTTADLHSVAANRATSEVVAGGSDGVVVSSANRGGSWGLVSTLSTSTDWQAVAFGSTQAYLGGQDCSIGGTSSGLLQGPVPPDALRGISFSGATGLAVGDQGKVVRSGDGGGNWQLVSELTPPVLSATHQVSATVGYAVGSHGVFLSTQDGGAHWEVSAVTTADLYGVHFADERTGVVIGAQGTLLRTTDGSNFSKINSTTTSTLRDVHATDGLWLSVGDNGTIVRSSNQGQSWQAVSSGTSSTLRAVYVIDATTAYAVGDNGTILRGTNAGQDWQVLKQSNGTSWTTARLNDVYFRDYVTGYVVGSQGVVLKTVTRGASWEPETGQAGNTELLSISPRAGESNTVAISGAQGTLLSYQDETDLYGSRFFYDKLGRLVISQNAKQFNKAVPAYSYTRYDALGRIKEVGEVATAARVEALEDAAGQVDEEKYKDWVASGTRSQITRTYYDEVVYQIADFAQSNLRNRVSSTTYQSQEGEAYDYATHYSYDIHGNVATLLQDNPALASINQQYKRVDYAYDLISGNVHEVVYQKNQRDQFLHRYEYDADNRIISVQTSSDGIVWDRDAGYQYYEHGPLARMELGEQRVQGVDYAYTIQGWLKGVNSTSLSPEKDMGKDGQPGSDNSTVARDEFGYSLSYFDGDYSAINAPSSDLDVNVGNNLYNGNIRNMTTSIRKFMQGGVTQTSAYEYDQLNRIKQSQAYDNRNGTLTEKPDYQTSYSYDANGNLLSLHRNATTAEGRKLMMDELEYVYENKANGYERNTNKLRQVRDAVAASNYSDDIDSQGKDNYAYDEIGNLVQDRQEDITSIDWTVYGKVAKVQKQDGSTIEFRYDAAGNRIAKRFKNQAEDRTTHYVRDASGNTMAIYEQSGSSFKLIEQPIYGSDMVGQRTLALEMTDGESGEEVQYHSVGVKAYYLKNHLKSVLATVSDRKDADGNAVMLSATDYFAFGMVQPGRSFKSDDSRHGFGGHEMDNEIAGVGNSYSFGDYGYDPRLGRRKSIDPLSGKYPGWSPYVYTLDNPIQYVDLDGQQPKPTSTDPRLEYDALLRNPEYTELTTTLLRSQIKSTYPDLEGWEINISAGNALEMAYGDFTGQPKGRNRLSTKGDNPLALRTVRPDFVHDTEVRDSEGKLLRFTEGGIIEVKAPQNPIDITTNSSQIDAEINLARWAIGNNGVMGTTIGGTYAEELKAGSYTLVLTADAQIDQRVVEESSRRGVNIYVQYSFQDRNSGEVVFSNPIKLNSISNELPSIVPGNLDRSVELNFERATKWTPTRKNSTNDGSND